MSQWKNPVVSLGASPLTTLWCLRMPIVLSLDRAAKFHPGPFLYSTYIYQDLLCTRQGGCSYEQKHTAVPALWVMVSSLGGTLKSSANIQSQPGRSAIRGSTAALTTDTFFSGHSFVVPELLALLWPLKRNVPQGPILGSPLLLPDGLIYS